MKTRLVLAMFVLVMVGIIAGCDSVESERNKQENNTPPPTEARTVPAELVDDLTKAADLIALAREDLDQGGDAAQQQAKRALGYPIFVDSDFSGAKALVAKLKTHTGPLSDYLFSPSTKTMIAKASDGEPSPELRDALRDDLNQHLKDAQLYSQTRFPPEKLTEKTRSELPANKDFAHLSPDRLVWLNRLMLQDSYREYIKSFSDSTVLRYLDSAGSRSADLKPAELRTNVQAKISDTKREINQLLAPSASTPESTLKPEDLADASDIVSIVLADLRVPEKAGGGDGLISFLGLSEGLAGVLKYVAMACAALVVAGGIFWLIRRQRGVTAEHDAATRQALKKIFDRQKQLEEELKLFKEQSNADLKDLTNQVTRLDNSYRTVARQSSKVGNQLDVQVADRPFEQTPPVMAKEEPAFPAAAEAYLQRMRYLNRQSTVIRPDFQNGILVKDPEGRGELVLIQDPRVSESLQRLLVIPSVGQFQMKQDFYNYYDRYYDCDQPSAGDVWILNPAVVEEVSGGWRLMEKGRLEVR